MNMLIFFHWLFFSSVCLNFQHALCALFDVAVLMENRIREGRVGDSSAEFPAN